jgi:AcrR family transcriptional regulator
LASLLDAAAAAIDHVGFERLTTAMVAERAGASIGTVYRYFPDRISVLQSVAARAIDRFSDRARTVLARRDLTTWWDAIDALIDEGVDAFAHEPAFAALRFGDVLDLRPREGDRTGSSQVSAVIAAAFAVDSPREALEIGLTEIPRHCRLAKDVRWALQIAPSLKSWREGREAVDKRFPGMHPVHTNNNACLTVFGLLLGGGDFTKTIGETVAMGLDNDCTAATAGSILGAILGIEGIPEHWWKPFRNRTRTYMLGQEWFRNTDVVDRFLRAAGHTWRGQGV